MPNRAVNTTRRRLLGGTLSAVALGGLPRILVAADNPAVTAISDSLYLISGVGGNVLAYASEGGLLLVDTGAANHTNALRQALATFAGGDRVHTVFNTHWHTDQVGGNAVFGEQGATIYAHDKTRQYLSIPYYLPAKERYQPAMPATAWPEHTFYDGGELSRGGHTLQYGYLEMAHTNADIYVRFRQANVIAVGDVVSPQRDPSFDWYSGGWIGGRVDALNRLLDLGDSNTQYVPAYGPVITRAHVEAERDMMQFLYGTLVDQVRMGFDYEDSLATGIMDNLPRQLDDPAQFLYDAHKGLWAHHNKLEPNIV